MTGKQLRAARLALNMSQKELAEALNMAANHIAIMERNLTPVRRVTEYAVMHLLAMSKKQRGRKRER
jgi:transcriptional regulator with XRE-family HTH domain